MRMIQQMLRELHGLKPILQTVPLGDREPQGSAATWGQPASQTIVEIFNSGRPVWP